MGKWDEHSSAPEPGEWKEGRKERKGRRPFKLVLETGKRDGEGRCVPKEEEEEADLFFPAPPSLRWRGERKEREGGEISLS